jgi:hypothetical protein
MNGDRVFRGKSIPGSAGVCPVNRVRTSSGPVMISALAWLIVWVRCARAVRLATISARIASTCPSRSAAHRPPARTGQRARRSPHPAGRTCPSGSGRAHAMVSRWHLSGPKKASWSGIRDLGRLSDLLRIA